MSKVAQSEPVTLALNYAPARNRFAYETLFALDHRLNQIVAGTREPRLAAIKLAWWRDQLEGLATSPDTADPLLIACRQVLRTNPVSGAQLGEFAEGWAMMLSPDLDDDDGLRTIALHRGAMLFAAISACVGAPSPDDAGRAYALADIMRASPDADVRIRVATMIAALPRARLANSLRPLTLLAHWARIDARRAISGTAFMTMSARAASALGFAIVPKSV